MNLWSTCCFYWLVSTNYVNPRGQTTRFRIFGPTICGRLLCMQKSAPTSYRVILRKNQLLVNTMTYQILPRFGQRPAILLIIEFVDL